MVVILFSGSGIFVFIYHVILIEVDMQNNMAILSDQALDHTRHLLNRRVSIANQF